MNILKGIPFPRNFSRGKNNSILFFTETTVFSAQMESARVYIFTPLHVTDMLVAVCLLCVLTAISPLWKSISLERI